MIGIIGALISAFGFGTANIVIKKSLASLTFAQTLFISTVSGAFFLTLFSLFSGAVMAASLQTMFYAALLALAEVVLYLFLYKSFAESNVTVATALITTYPLLSTIFTVLVLSESLTLLQVGSIVLLVLGAIGTSIRWEEVWKNGFDKGDLVKGLPWIIITTILHALYFPILGSFTATGDWETKLLLIKLFSAVFLFVGFYLVKKQSVLPPKQLIPFTSLLGLLEMTGWAGFSWATSNTTGQTAVIIAALNSSTLVTAIWAYFVLNERLSKLQYLGVLIVVASLTGLTI